LGIETLVGQRPTGVDKIVGNNFEQPQAGPAGVKGRMPGIIPMAQPLHFLTVYYKYDPPSGGLFYV